MDQSTAEPGIKSKIPDTFLILLILALCVAVYAGAAAVGAVAVIVRLNRCQRDLVLRKEAG